MISTIIAAGTADFATAVSAEMDEERFRAFYDLTGRPLRRYLLRMLKDPSQADDLLQESYLRLLRAKLPDDMTDEHRKNYLFRIATNLLHDEHSRRNTVPLTESASPELLASEVTARNDMRQFLAKLKPRERELLWLAYVERFNHNEIAGIVGAKPQSIRSMLSRARENLADVLRRGGFGSPDLHERRKQEKQA